LAWWKDEVCQQVCLALISHTIDIECVCKQDKQFAYQDNKYGWCSLKLKPAKVIIMYGSKAGSLIVFSD